MSSNLRQVFGDLRRHLTPESRQYIERLVDRPEVRKVLLEDEGEQLAIRRALIESKSATLAKFEKPLSAAAKRVEAAEKRKRAHDVELLAIEAELMSARGELVGLSYGQESAIGRADFDLREGASPLLNDAWRHLEALRTGGINRAFTHGVLMGRDRIEAAWSNSAECQAASDALRAALDVCRDLQLQALSTVEVESRLSALFAGLASVLRAVKLSPPTIESGEVKAPVLVQ